MNDSGFYLFTEYQDKFRRLDDAQFGQLIRYLLLYKASGEVPEIGDVIVGMAFDVVKSDIDKQSETYKKRAEAGKKGGLTAKPEEANGSRLKQSEANGSQVKQTEANESEAKPEEANGSIKRKRKEKEKKTENNSESISYEIDRRTDVTTEDVDRVVGAWNTLPASVPKVQKIVSGSKRDKMLRARIREYGLIPVILAVEKVRQSDFLCGRNKKGWTISFDWFVGPENFPKVSDGNYTTRSGTTDAEPMSGRDYLLQMIREGGADERGRDEQDPVYDPGELSETL